MAANKDKLLESAQKSLKKKQIPKAIKDFIKVVEIDPSDVRSRQKLAELLVRTGRNEEAYEHFETVAKYFATNGFYLKAIAIYKQMQRLDSSQVVLFSRLAELNEKQGLIGNAMAEYRNLITHYEQNGMTADVIKVLEKMRDLDTANLNVRVKLAEVYASNAREDEGLAEFESVLEVLGEKGDIDKVLKLYKMFMPIFPDSKKLKMGLALALYDKGEHEKGVTILLDLLEEKPKDPDLLRLVSRGYSTLQDWPNAIEIHLKQLALDPTDLDIRDSYVAALIGSQKYEKALEELEEWKDNFHKAERLGQLKGYYEELKEHLSENRAVLQTLDSIYELTGEGDKLLDIISEAEDKSAEEVKEETLSDSILASAEEDIEMPAIELDIPLEEESQYVSLLHEVPEEEDDLQLDSFIQDDSVDLTEEEAGEEAVIELDLDDSDELETEADDLELSFDISDEDEDLAPAEEKKDVSAQLEEAEFYIQQGLYEEAEKVCTDVLTFAPDSEECQKKLDIVLQHLRQGGGAPEAIQEEMEVEFQIEESEEEAAAETETEDFLSALGEETEETVDDFFNAIEDEGEEKKVFRTDVDEQIAADDMESHYNLGIAYREMGLLDDAISEFGKAEKDPTRFVDCQTLKGLCYIDKGDFANAELMYQQALDSQHLEDEQRLSLGYELASLYESSERFEEALSSYRVVVNQDSTFRDAKEKVTSLQEKLGIVVEDEVVNKERISFL